MATNNLITWNRTSGTYSREEAIRLATEEADRAAMAYEHARKHHLPIADLRRSLDHTTQAAHGIIGAARNPSIVGYGWIQFSD